MTPIATTKDDGSSPDVLAARAMERVLHFESAAQAAVAECERTCAEILNQAREQRRGILERSQTRIVAMHGRAARRLEVQAADLSERRRQSAAATAEHLSDPGRRGAALDRLAARLTTSEVARPRDDN